MQYFYNDEPLADDPERTEDWDDLFDVIDQADRFGPVNMLPGGPPSYAVLRLVFRRGDPSAPRPNWIDVLTWRETSSTGHGHPESDAIRWLRDQKRRNPAFGRGVRQVRMLIENEPCEQCLHNLRASLGSVLPTGSRVHVKWVKPAPKRRFAFFRDRRYTPSVTRWR